MDKDELRTLREMIPKADRTFFHWPIRESTTKMFYSHKQDLCDFQDMIERSIPTFIQNMKNLKNTGKKYPEEWMETFCCWLEIEEER